MSSPLSALNRAANAPRWVAVTLAVVAASSTTVVAGHRHLSSAAPAELAAPAPAAADAVRREPLTSRDFDRTAQQTGEHPVEQRVKRSIPIVRKPIPTMPTARSDAAETVAAAKASTYNIPGQCLGWAREQADIPSRYSTAAVAWEHATGRHPGDLTPPKGAAVYWIGGSSGAGHIAISVGHGLVRSSDAGGSGVVATISVRQLTREWGDLTYVGWADSINGYRIPGVART